MSRNLEVERLEKALYSLIDNMDMLMPSEFSLGELALKCGVHKDTIAKHLKSNFLENKDFRYTGKGGKIWVAREAALEIRRYYNGKAKR